MTFPRVDAVAGTHPRSESVTAEPVQQVAERAPVVTPLPGRQPRMVPAVGGASGLTAPRESAGFSLAATRRERALKELAEALSNDMGEHWHAVSGYFETQIADASADADGRKA